MWSFIRPVVFVAMVAAMAALAYDHFKTVFVAPYSAGADGQEMIFLRDRPASQFARGPEEPELDYVQRMSNLVYSATGHCLPSDSRLSTIERLLLLPIPELKWQGILTIERFECGFCHQRSHILSTILGQNGTESFVLGLNGHVVVQFAIGDSTYVADPDYGIAPFRYDLQREALRAEAMAVYAAIGSSNDELIANMYATSEDNGPYISPTILYILEAYQRIAFWLATAAATLCVVGSLVLSGLAFKHTRRVSWSKKT